MVYRGHVRNGRIELDEPVSLPEGAAVEIAIPSNGCDDDDDEQQGPTLYDRMKPFIGSARGLPPDASINVDHYLRGQCKQ